MALASANGNDTVDKPSPPSVRAKVWRVCPLFRNRLARLAHDDSPFLNQTTQDSSTSSAVTTPPALRAPPLTKGGRGDFSSDGTRRCTEVVEGAPTAVAPVAFDPRPVVVITPKTDVLALATGTLERAILPSEGMDIGVARVNVEEVVKMGKHRHSGGGQQGRDRDSRPRPHGMAHRATRSRSGRAAHARRGRG